MNPAFSFQPYQVHNDHSTMMNMNALNMNMNFPMNFDVGYPQQSRPMPFFASDDAFPSEPEVSLVPSSVAVHEQSQVNIVANDSSSSSAGSSVRSFVAERKPLAPDFVPGPYDVICARGAAAANSPGNLRFRKLIQEILPEYSKATSKLEKGLLVSRVVDGVRDMTPNGGFIKKIGNRWYEVGDAACREKIGQCIRDQLHTKYKSSTKAKKPRRKELKEIKKRRQMERQEDKEQPQPAKISSKGIAKEDENELSLTNIFYSAFVDEGLNLDTILRC